MSTGEMSTVVSSDARRYTIVNLKQVNELPLRNVLQTFDNNGDGKIDTSELQKIVYWYGLWKYASIGLCLIVMTLVWATFGLTIWAIDLTKDYSVTDGVLTGGDEVVKMSVASTYIPLSWATLLDRRHLDSLESLSIDVTQSSGKFSAGMYHMKVASYLHSNSSYLKVFGEDGSRVWVNSGTVVLHHSDAEEAIMVCGAAACNTLAVDVKPEYLQQLVQRSVALFENNRDFELPASVEGVAINKAAGKDATCMASVKAFATTNILGSSISQQKTFPTDPAFKLSPIVSLSPTDPDFADWDFSGRRLLEAYALKTIAEVPKFNQNGNDIYIKFGEDSDGSNMVDNELVDPELVKTLENFKFGGRRRLGGDGMPTGDFEGAIKSEDLPTRRRRLQIDPRTLKTLEEGLKINPTVHGGLADLDAKIAAMDAEKKLAFEELINKYIHGRRRLMSDVDFDLNINDGGIEAITAADNAIQVADAAVDPALTAAFEEFGRRRLQDSNVVDLINSIDLNLSNFGSQASNSADVAVAVGEAAVLDHAAAWDRGFDRRRLENDVFKAFNTVDLGLVDSGGRVEDALKAAYREAAAERPQAWKSTSERFTRRRLQDLGEFVGAVTKVGMNLRDNGDQAFEEANSLFEEAAKENEDLREAVTSFLPSRRRFQEDEPRIQTERRRVEGPIDVSIMGIVNMGYGKIKQEAARFASEAATTTAGILSTDEDYQVGGSTRRRFQDEPLVQTERRRLPGQQILGYVETSVKSGPNTNGINDFLKKVNQNGQLAAGAIEKAGPALEEFVDNNGRRLLTVPDLDDAEDVQEDVAGLGISLHEGGIGAGTQEDDNSVATGNDATGPAGVAEAIGNWLFQ